MGEAPFTFGMKKTLDVITKLDLSHGNAQASGKRLEEEAPRRFRGGKDSMTAGDDLQLLSVVVTILTRVRKE